MSSMNVIVEPETILTFQKSGDAIKETIKIANKDSKPIAFKVKTTAPKQYCVRPSVGVVPSGETVSIMLQMNEKDHEIDHSKTKDRFLIQWAYFEGGAEADLNTFWAESEKPEKKAEVGEKKLKCQVLLPDGKMSTQEDTKADSPKMISKAVTSERPKETLPQEASTSDKSLWKISDAGATASPTQRLQQLLLEASEKNKTLLTENTTLKSQVKGNPPIVPPSNPAIRASIKPKPRLELFMVILVSGVSLVFGFLVGFLANHVNED